MRPILPIPCAALVPRRVLSGLTALVLAAVFVSCRDEIATAPQGNQPPSVTITSPVSGLHFLERSGIPFQGTATDPEDGKLPSSSLDWVSSIDGPFWSGETFTYDGLSRGEHTVWLLATDSDGARDSASILVTIAPGVTVSDSAGPIFRTLLVSLASAAAIQVDYWSTETPRLRVTSPVEVDQHSVFLPRLRSSTTYQYEVRPVGTALAASADSALYRGEFQTGPLPSELSGLRLDADGTPTFPLTMIEVRRPSLQVVVDQDGEIVWYRGKTSQGFTRLANGNFVFNERTRLSIETPDHQVVARLERTAEMGEMHHEVITTPDNTLLFLTQLDEEVDGVEWRGEAIWEWDPESGAVMQRWNAFDFLDPSVDRGDRTSTADWLHANSLAIGPRGNVLVSFFWLHEVLSIAADYQSLEWRLGGPASSFTVQGGAMEAGQHTAAEVSPGRVLLFDNGLDRPGDLFFSRAFEIELDHQAGTAEIVWEFRPQPDIYAPFMSSVRKLDNGNNVALFGIPEGIIGATGPVAIFEVTPSVDVVWSLHLEGFDGGVYRATPLEHIGWEEEVDSS